MASVIRPLIAAPNQIELTIGGMTCASCASRIEKKLNRIDGVTATVNYATEKATVTVEDTGVTAQDLIAMVEKTGYAAELPRPPQPLQADGGAPGGPDELGSLRTRLWVSLVLTVPV